MDFHSLTRRELQSLCKLNKIPANITNVAMADALQSLDIVKGVEKFMNVSQSEKAADLVRSAETIEVSSPKAPHTRCRKSTRQKGENTETESLPPTATRTTRRAIKQLAGGVKDMLKTPAISTTIRKAKTPSTSSCRNVNKQLNACHKESLTEKKSAEPRVKKDCEKSVDEVNVTSEEDVTVESGNPNAQVEDIFNAFEKLDVLPVVEEINQCPMLEKAVDVEATHKSIEEIKDCGELDSLKKESDDKSYPCEDGDEEEKLKIGENDSTEDENDEVYDISGPCEEEIMEQKLDLEDEKSDASEVKDHNLVMVQEEQSSCRNVNNQLNACHKESLTEKKSAEPRVKEDSEKSVKIKSFLDEVNVTSEEDVTMESGNPVEDICNAFEKPGVLPVVEEINQGPVLEKAVDVEATQKSREEIKDCGELDSLKESDDKSYPCEDGDQEEKLKIGENDSTQAENDQVYDISGPCEEEILEQKLDLEDEKSDASEIKDHNLVMVQEEQSDGLLDNNAGLESGIAGADDTVTSPEFGEDVFSAVLEMNNLVPESNGSSTMASDMILDNTENNFGVADEITTKEMNQVSENKVEDVIPTVDNVDNASTVIEEAQDLKPDLFIEKADADSTKEKDQFCVFSENCFPIQNPLILSDVIGHPTRVTPMKKATPFKNMSIVSNDKENIDSGRKLEIVFVDEGKKSKKEKDETLRSLNDVSLRQLKKKVKELTLKSINSNEDKGTLATRPALQAICENKLVDGESKN